MDSEYYKNLVIDALYWQINQLKYQDPTELLMNHEHNFLLNFIRYAKGTEVPDQFAIWSGISAISAALGRRLFLDMGHYFIFPNTYVILIASSGRFRKSTAIDLSKWIVDEVSPKLNIIPEKLTPEALYDALAASSLQIEGTKILSRATGFLFGRELATFLNRKTYEAGLGSMLIDFWDCPKTWVYRTKSRGAEELEQPCLGLLSASTVDWIKDAIPPEAVGGGLTSRCIFVYADNPPAPIARTSQNEEKLKLKSLLVSTLQSITALNGPVELTKEAWESYEKEYLSFYNTSTMYLEKHTSGYASRRHVHWLKLAMIMAAAELKLVIEPKHLKASLGLLEEAEKYMKLVLGLITASEMGSYVQKIADFIATRKSARRDEIIKAMIGNLSARQVNDILETLSAAGIIRLDYSSRSPFYVYIK